MIKLGDLNVSKVVKFGLLKTQTGTPYYVSPEIWADKPYSYKSDIWSLGAVIYELAALKPPFMANDMKTLASKVMKGVYPSIPHSYSSDLSTIIKFMLQVRVDSRPGCDEILKNSIIQKHMNSEQKSNLDVASNSDGLLGTIKMPMCGPRGAKLPGPKYENKAKLDLRRIDSTPLPDISNINKDRVNSARGSRQEEYKKPAPNNGKPGLPPQHNGPALRQN